LGMLEGAEIPSPAAIARVREVFRASVAPVSTRALCAMAEARFLMAAMVAQVGSLGRRVVLGPAREGFSPPAERQACPAAAEVLARAACLRPAACLRRAA